MLWELATVGIFGAAWSYAGAWICRHQGYVTLERVGYGIGVVSTLWAIAIFILALTVL